MQEETRIEGNHKGELEEIGMASNLRNEIEEVKGKVWGIKDQLSGRESAKQEDRGEQMANLMLAYRHLEDARMRLGKFLQASTGGESIYDKKD